MFTTSLMSAFVTLSRNMIQKDPGVIVGPITKFLGMILNAIFNFAYQFGAVNSLGISIILLTIIARLLMLPLAFQQQRSMMNMQKLQPAIEKIKKKYGDSKDPENTKKMNEEMQRIYTENKINPLMGCLPLVIQMPIFIALNYIMRQSYQFINVIGDIYYKTSNSLAETIINLSGYLDENGFFETVLRPLAFPKIPNGMELNLNIPEQLAKVLNNFTSTDWSQLLSQMPEGAQNTMNQLLEQKAQIEHFLGINLIEKSVDLSGGFQHVITHLWPGVLIPILAVVATFFSSYIMNKQSKATDENAKMQQKVMTIFMPIMMGGMTIGFPAGVGLYWITSSVFQVVQQVALYKYHSKKDQADLEAASQTIVDVKPMKPAKNVRKKK